MRIWWERAACAGTSNDLFFREDEFSIYAAKQLCKSCIVRPECRAEALAFTRSVLEAGRDPAKVDYGIFAGLTPSERVVLVRSDVSRYSDTEPEVS
jgi:hypothetical protein